MVFPSQPRRPRAVLVIEPDDETRDAWTIALRAIGCRPVAATNAGEALRTLERAVPDLILMELLLPDASGTKLCTRLRSHPPTSMVPILVVTAWSHAPDLQAAQCAGANVVLHKPVPVDSVMKAVQNLAAPLFY